MTKIFTHDDLIQAFFGEIKVSDIELAELLNNDHELAELWQMLLFVHKHIEHEQPSEACMQRLTQAIKKIQ